MIPEVDSEEKKAVVVDLTFKLSLASKSLDYAIVNVTSEERYAVIEEDALRESYESLFGSNTYQRADFYYDVFTFSWSEEHQDYRTVFLDELGGATCGGSQTDFAYAKQVTSSTENKIEIYEYFYFADCGENTNYYSDYNKTNFITASSYISEEDMLKNYVS